jgi:hypothetical protein
MKSDLDQLHFSCDHCQAELVVPSSYAGTSAHCPNCHDLITAPEPPPVTDPVQLERPTRTKRSIPQSRPAGIALFEKKGFLPLRTGISVAACAVIFMSFQALKSRRWIFASTPVPAEKTAQKKALPIPEIPESTPTNGVPPPRLPNLRSLSSLD